MCGSGVCGRMVVNSASVEGSEEEGWRRKEDGGGRGEGAEGI